MGDERINQALQDTGGHGGNVAKQLKAENFLEVHRLPPSIKALGDEEDYDDMHQQACVGGMRLPWRERADTRERPIEPAHIAPEVESEGASESTNPLAEAPESMERRQKDLAALEKLVGCMEEVDRQVREFSSDVSSEVSRLQEDVEDIKRTQHRRRRSWSSLPGV